MMWDLPVSVEINRKIHAIRNKCDYRVVLDVISALNDNELTEEEKIKCALIIFYENILDVDDFESAVNEMFKVINLGEEQSEEERKPKLMDWEHDFNLLVAPINRVLGYEIREGKWLHWYTFLGAYYEIGECTFANVVSIRSKKAKGKKLEKWEQDFYRENKKMVDLPQNLTEEEQEWLDSDW